ncbi:MAG: 1-(5-phosphoribosyl)-5-[(5-phosphoribosylamino)methylideneamino]imidazole-4-carboxamide isomerase [Peptococcaceae bacterium]
MSFTIYPAVDIRGGKCVRLFQGDYNMESIYFKEPLAAADKWYEAGAEWLHIIDLDGAKTGNPDNSALIKDILRNINIKIQVGGGIRSRESVKAYLDNGAARVILGSIALKDELLIKSLIEEFGPRRIIVSLDGKNNQAYREGWLENAGKDLVESAESLAAVGVEKFIYTDIEKDGTLTGPNIKNSLNIADKTGCEVIAAGGIGSEKDVLALAECADRGIGGAVIGRALYTGDIDLKSLIAKLGRD